MSDDEEDRDRDFVGGLARGLKVIECFDDEHERLTIAEVAGLTGLSRAAARRSLLTLERLGYARSDGRGFCLTPRILRLGYAFLESTALPQLMQPFLEHLSERLNESCSASVRDGDQLVYIARSATRRIVSVGLAVGSRLPLHCTSMGRVLLSGMPRSDMIALLKAEPLRRLTPHTQIDLDAVVAAVDAARSDGYALVDQELEVGLISLAVPVINSSGEVVAALNAGSQASRMSARDMLDKCLAPLLATQKSLRPLVRT
ncbi:IclR family transcriptional regulator domain-containing protein [Oryzibacter oryziterrae]|uniref:IclR family transcriptional regulator domain-containing protein n=1 Tax=Oryzibacter oryziterrae TaxID=2766474 RepID=UPI001EFFA272|nr:IclR family transcriptional regulator C-terminal domain-containing protein [Oryzibacter oryziterrae]